MSVVQRVITETLIKGIFLSFFLYIGYIEDVSGQVREYCNSESFTPRCGDQEVIVINHGLYGRMHQGKCMASVSGLGCKTNALQTLDDLCSNKAYCEVYVSSDFVALDNPCPLDMLRYLEAEFKCEKVLQIQQSECRSTSTKIDIASKLSVSSEILAKAVVCGSSSITFIARPGQQINITITDFNYHGHSNNQQSCINYLELIEQSTGKTQPVCAGSYDRTGQVMLSSGHGVTAVFHVQDPRNQRFILTFEALGCGDIIPPEGTWVQRDGDHTTLGCHSGKHSWTLSCENNQWLGSVGSCGTAFSVAETPHPTAKQEQKIAIGMVVFGFCSILLLICSTSFSVGVCVYSKRNEKGPLSSQRYQPTLPLVAHNRQHPPTQIPNNQVLIEQQQIINANTKMTTNQTPQLHKDENSADQMYCNTMHSQTDSVYSDSVKYYVLENLHEPTA